MNDIKTILQQYKDGVLSLDEAAAALRCDEPSVLDLGFANLDLQRQKRCGFPEVVYCAGKTVGQSVQILRFS